METIMLTLTAIIINEYISHAGWEVCNKNHENKTGSLCHFSKLQHSNFHLNKIRVFNLYWFFFVLWQHLKSAILYYVPNEQDTEYTGMEKDSSYP